MRIDETPIEKAYREAIEEAIRQLDLDGMHEEAGQDSGNHMAWATLSNVLEDVDRGLAA